MRLEQLQDKKNNKTTHTQKKDKNAIKQYKTNPYIQAKTIILKIQKIN